MLTLYHAPRSRSSRIVWLLEELEAEHELVYVDIERMGAPGQADPRNPHPDKKVPALVHDGTLVTESAAITLYLTDLFPEAGLAPAIGDAKRGPYLTWLAYCAGVIEPVAVIEFAKLGANEALSRSFRGVPEMQRRIVGALEAGPYLLGETFSAADIFVGTLIEWGRNMLPPGEPVDGYRARLSERPALARALARDAPGGA